MATYLTSFLARAWEVRTVKHQENYSNGSRDTTDNVVCSPSLLSWTDDDCWQICIASIACVGSASYVVSWNCLEWNPICSRKETLSSR